MTATKKDKFFILEWYEKNIGYKYTDRISLSIVVKDKIQIHSHNIVSFELVIRDSGNTYGGTFSMRLYKDVAIKLLESIDHFDTKKGYTEILNYIKIKHGSVAHTIIADLEIVSNIAKPLKILMCKIEEYEDHIKITK